MISADRFVANKQYFHQGWLNARRSGVTATQVAKLQHLQVQAAVIDTLMTHDS